ncbi:MAG TPA: hypothetical protein PLE72_06365 [Azospira sp.]|nr:hypothetical protein [Azospira sp.]HNN08007.1 hypothetical protein [Azospira sp.]HNN45312.1 hypothetical protein [Azospira sp.]
MLPGQDGIHALKTGDEANAYARSGAKENSAPKQRRKSYIYYKLHRSMGTINHHQISPINRQWQKNQKKRRLEELIHSQSTDLFRIPVGM